MWIHAEVCDVCNDESPEYDCYGCARRICWGCLAKPKEGYKYTENYCVDCGEEDYQTEKGGGEA